MLGPSELPWVRKVKFHKLFFCDKWVPDGKFVASVVVNVQNV